MATLKHKIALSVLAVFISITTFAQDDKAMQAAFSASYASETNGNYVKAIEDLKSVYKETSYPINLRLGWLSYMASKSAESVVYYKKAIKIKPRSIEARLGVAYTLSKMLNWDALITNYKEILTISSDNNIALYRLGLIYYNRAQYAEAKKYLVRLVATYPFDYDANILLAWTELKLGNKGTASALFNHVLLIKPYDASALEGLKGVK